MFKNTCRSICICNFILKKSSFYHKVIYGEQNDYLAFLSVRLVTVKSVAIMCDIYFQSYQALSQLSVC